MSLFVASLNSGSNGNCYYIGNGSEAVLVDVGISCREVEKRMKSLGLDLTTVRAIFITHEHTDHISGLPGLLKKYRLPVYITEGTLRAAAGLVPAVYAFGLTAFATTAVGNLSITAFPKRHDAADAHSIVVSHAGITVGVFTDIGAPCRNVIHYFSQCHAVFLETNYDEQMLAASRYPVFLRNRISGSFGHLSNAQALQLFMEHRPRFMTHLFLSHLSKENNCPEKTSALFNQHANGVKIIHASRHAATAVYEISSDILNHPAPIPPALKPKAKPAQLQLSLF